jgi:hypothetical protein
MIKRPHNISNGCGMQDFEAHRMPPMRRFEGKIAFNFGAPFLWTRFSSMACATAKAGYIISHQNRFATGGRPGLEAACTARS